MKLLTIIATLMISLPASAQTWYATPNTTPMDYSRLPASVTFDWAAPPGWEATNGSTWVAIWPRDARAGWYRPAQYTQPNLIRRNVYPFPYSCSASGLGFRCRDLLRGATRTVACPASTIMGPLKMWRSAYIDTRPEYGLFTAGVWPFLAYWNRPVAVSGASVTANGQQLNCAYGPLTGAGPGTALDVWVFYR